MESKSLKNCEKLYEPESWKELSELLLPTDTRNRPVYVWRGQADINWPLHSGAYRRIANSHKTDVTNEMLINYEIKLLERATHGGYRNSENRILTDFELLAKLQHHGAATRLIDFTSNIFIGLYFCASSHPDETGVLIGMHAEYITGREEQTEERTYKQITSSIESHNAPSIYQPTRVTPRIASQQSFFLYSAVADQKIGSLYIAPNSDHEACIAIAISPALKVHCLNFLSRNMGIQDTTIFPDLNGFSIANSSSETLRKHNRWFYTHPD